MPAKKKGIRGIHLPDYTELKTETGGIFKMKSLIDIIGKVSNIKKYSYCLYLC